ncbi:SLBB domain-containing protein [Coraliomargarita algicola]|uniref:SLBB domain-containing protein n=1 Tax=Coraliomargarita algicola TaxID=3092156 RepID=A0ABZ0RKS9_9BACT|nr:SLBB domain-containing protein [Coraliomargarita sp. J2-16]WPJ96824.1 SLBB domain-containing protein [Coraliomargarita sp. J2-16]
MMLVSCFLLLTSGCRHTGEVDVFDPRVSEESRTQEEIFKSMEQKRQLTPAELQPNLAPYKIGVGDWLEIEITGIGGSRSRTFVMPDGRIYYDLAGGIKADGLTVAELSEKLEEALRRDYTSPSVNVTLREVRSRRAWLLGRLNKPGLYPLSQPTTVLEGISLAGGLFSSRQSGSTEELADLGNSFVLRKGEVLPIDLLALIKEGDMSQNIYLRDGDYVYLPSSLSQNVHVLGAVRQPQAIGYKDNLNLVAAIAKARGPSSDANLDKVLIIRGSHSAPKVAVVDFKSILAGKATNVELKPFDIVWVPDRPFQFLERYFWVAFNAAATTIAVREGSNSVETIDGVSPGISFPIGQ